MSLYGALFSGVSGLGSQASAMGAIADNVTNVNTVGYKGTKVNFQTLITKQVSTTKYSAGGVQSKPRQSVDVQGLLQASTSATDVAISGQGMFVVTKQAEPSGDDPLFAYSRAGSFKVDKDGYLQNSGGWYLQGWPLLAGSPAATQASHVQANGDDYIKAYKAEDGSTSVVSDSVVSTTHLKPLNLNEFGGTAQATTSIRMGANLPASADVGDTPERGNVLVYDSFGNGANLQFVWSKSGINTWDMEVVPPEGATNVSVTNTDAAKSVYGSMGRFDFFEDAQPANGDTYTVDVGGTTYTFSFNNTGTDDLDDTTNNDKTYDIDVSGRTASQTLDAITTALDNALRVGVPAASSQGAAATVTTGGDIVFTDATGATTTVTVANGATKAAVVAAINTAFGSTVPASPGAPGTPANLVGVAAQLDANGEIALYAQNNVNMVPWNISYTGAANTLATDLGLPANTQFGGAMAERLSGTNSIIYRQTSADDMTIDLSTMVSSGQLLRQQNAGQPYTVDGLDLGTVANGIVFNGDGTPNTFFGSQTNIGAELDINWANGAKAMEDVAVFLGNADQGDGMTQYAGAYQIAYVNQNGAKFGNFAGVSIGRDGIVTAMFDNGVTRPVFMIPVATFINPNGMENLSGNVWIATDNSGNAVLREAGNVGAGEIQSAALESSTVDLAEEFTNMITTQRAYSAAAKIITSADEMLDELVRIKR